MQLDEILAQGRDALTVRRVFGDPIERDGLTVIPVANVMGGGGGGGDMASLDMGAMAGSQGSDADASSAEGRPVASERGGGAGFGVRATPAGVYVIKGGEVRWEPALDMTRIAIMGQVVGIVFLLVLRSILKSRSS